MMTEERVRQYKASLEKEARDAHIDRMAALDKEQYDKLPDYDQKFQEVVAQISAVNYILTGRGFHHDSTNHKKQTEASGRKGYERP